MAASQQILSFILRKRMQINFANINNGQITYLSVLKSPAHTDSLWINYLKFFIIVQVSQSSSDVATPVRVMVQLPEPPPHSINTLYPGSVSQLMDVNHYKNEMLNNMDTQLDKN